MMTEPRKPSAHVRKPGSGRRRAANMLSKSATHEEVCFYTGAVQMSHDRAVTSAKICRDRYDDDTSEYRCTVCEWWHIGTRSVTAPLPPGGKKANPKRKRAAASIERQQVTSNEPLPIAFRSHDQ